MMNVSVELLLIAQLMQGEREALRATLTEEG